MLIGKMSLLGLGAAFLISGFGRLSLSDGLLPVCRLSVPTAVAREDAVRRYRAITSKAVTQP